MRYSVEWQDEAENAALEERATVADLRLEVGGINATQYLFDGVLRDHVTVALYGLVHGLVHDWWSIFGSRDRDIHLSAHRSGYILPDIRVRFDGEFFEIEAHQCTYQSLDVRFWGGLSESMSRQEGEAVLTNLVERVLSRLSDRGHAGTAAALRWKRVQASRISSEAAFCEAAGALGLDPYAVDEETADFIEQAERLFEPGALVDFVAGAARVKQRALLEWVDAMRRHRGSRYSLAELRVIVDGLADRALRVGEQAWAVGYRRASEIRHALGLPKTHSFHSFQDIARLFGAARSYTLAPRVDGIRALRSERDDGTQIHLRNQGHSAEAQAAHLFAMARGIGDAACFPSLALTPINDLRTAHRQAAGRAFAAEFLAPIDEIQSMLDDRFDVATIANHFSVSAAVIGRQMQNKDRIAAACAV